MCGITGWVAFDSDLTTSVPVIEAMTETLGNRGPDAGGTWIRTHVALGHRRLAVIDLPGGMQPMEVRTPSGTVALTFSGEVYNFLDLRAELEGRGHRFTTRSDTEVVLRGYLEWGEAVAERLNGMYAFGLWDERYGKLVLIRDRVGVKPLYYHRTSDGVLFGSEPKAILANPRFPRVVDTGCLRELVGFTKAPGWSLWKDMYEVEPGTVLTATRAGIRHHTYWRLETTAHTDDPGTTVEKVGELFGDAVRRQTVSDVPQCVLLSGGLDSSAVTAVAAAELRTRGEKTRTFSVDFAGYEENFRPDELRETPDSPFVRAVAAHVGSVHHDIVLDSHALADPALRRAVVAARDMPIGLGDIDSSMYLLFRAIRAECTVALSGEFADELFGGYAWFHHPAARDADTFPWLAFSNAYTGDRTEMLRPELSRDLDIGAYVADEYRTAVAAIDHLDGEDALERRMRRSSHLHVTRLVRAMLDRKDRMSMAVGLEVRVPFADHRLIEYVYNVPWSMKADGGREKSLLRGAVAGLLPRSVTERVKSPYPSTQDTGYAEALQRQANDVLAEAGHPLFAIFDAEWVRGAATRDPAAVTGRLRTGLERLLDLYHWFDLYRPELRLG
ncbi:asparagine synthase (glutamine-hydrolyzing) [Amycolatopsis regifaucium]|uniref:asparagine synthase (glutamine-hydrolyzing) n=1 Tax=Amycolatopsis regifaucium TaxID=546365 RepID=A0A154MUN8_9PSEU|nr:asparagine synthase (glutamine-hydrolyzing) [Amycolatopsis regifaucium]KZB87992.1 asparagine synthetase B [Amycolatopsis regifaucium]OKA04502.1 asparagine synthase (glutamine-hydrolyzing) [Amycolatopsis regifaucium]SFH50791.1 asparagine synthase (glutamine-hydrolysing) [Amycolatopsis regifaucium]